MRQRNAAQWLLATVARSFVGVKASVTAFTLHVNVCRFEPFML